MFVNSGHDLDILAIICTSSGISSLVTDVFDPDLDFTEPLLATGSMEDLLWESCTASVC